MQKRPLGRTGHMSTQVILGAAAFWEADQATVDQTMELALQRGINHIDVSPVYGVAEERLGHWLPARRDQFFVGCKTLRRKADEVWEDINRSLETLKIDSFDLYQMHHVCTMVDIEEIFAPGGALEGFIRAREAGLTHFIGMAGHGLESPVAQAEGLACFDFDTVMFPINPNLFAKPEFRSNALHLLNLAIQKDVGVMIIKSVAKTLWGKRQKTYQPWYEPFDTMDKITEGVHFALSQPGVTAVASVGEVRLLPMVFDAGESFVPMREDRQAAAIEAWEPLTSLFPGPLG